MKNNFFQLKVYKSIDIKHLGILKQKLHRLDPKKK